MSSLRNLRCGPNPRRTDRGSAVITVLVLAAVTAVIASSFLSRSAQEARLAMRSHYMSVALNLAEAGIEEALYAANSSKVNTTNGWALASGSTTDYTKSITTGFSFQQATGAIYMRVDGAAGATPTFTAAAVVTIPNQRTIVKQLRVRSPGPTRLWANSVVAKGNVTFSGSADIDSYNSTVGPWHATTNRSDLASVATSATVQISNSAYIYGYVSTDGEAPNVGGTGRIYGATSPGTPLVDPARVRTDFNTNLTDATAPTTTAYALGAVVLSGSSNSSLPRVGDLPGANGRYLYTCTSITISGTSYVSLKAPIDIICTGNTTLTESSYINVGGTGAVNPSLNFYSPGTITLTGQGMINTTAVPSNLKVWGTKPSGSTQTIALGSSVAFKGVIYAPNANVTMTSSANMHGAVICNTMTLADTSVLHYDIQLAQHTTAAGPTPGAGSGNGYLRIGSWTELTDSPTSGSAFARDNRAPFASLF